MKFWGWGYADEAVSADEVGPVVSHITGQLGVLGVKPVAAPRLEDIELKGPRVSVPGSLADICSIEHYDRVVHTYGKSFIDYARILSRDFATAPDVVAYPNTEREVIDLLDWASRANVAAIPFGAGSSVVGGIERRSATATTARSPSIFAGWMRCSRSTRRRARRASRRAYSGRRRKRR